MLLIRFRRLALCADASASYARECVYSAETVSSFPVRRVNRHQAACGCDVFRRHLSLVNEFCASLNITPALFEEQSYMHSSGFNRFAAVEAVLDRIEQGGWVLNRRV